MYIQAMPMQLAHTVACGGTLIAKEQALHLQARKEKHIANNITKPTSKKQIIKEIWTPGLIVWYRKTHLNEIIIKIAIVVHISLMIQHTLRSPECAATAALTL